MIFRARQFVRASSEVITCAIGSANFAFGPGSIVSIVCVTIDGVGNRTMLTLGTGTNVQWILNSSGAPVLWNGAATSTATFTLLASEGWALLAVDKATGSVAPRFHKYVYATGLWTHAAGGTAIANAGVPGTSLYLGGKSAGDFWNGYEYLSAVWNTVKTDAEYEQMAPQLPNIIAASPTVLHILDKPVADGVVSEAGSSNQTAITGTTMISDPIPNFVGRAALSHNYAGFPKSRVQAAA